MEECREKRPLRLFDRQAIDVQARIVDATREECAWNSSNGREDWLRRCRYGQMVNCDFSRSRKRPNYPKLLVYPGFNQTRQLYLYDQTLL